MHADGQYPIRADSDDPTSAPAQSRWYYMASLLWAPSVSDTLLPPTAVRRTTARPASPSFTANQAVVGRTAKPQPRCGAARGPSPCMSTAVAPAALGPYITLHIHCRRSSSARPMDHGSPWYPTHSTASKSLRGPSHGHHRAECRVTCGPDVARLAGTPGDLPSAYYTHPLPGPDGETTSPLQQRPSDAPEARTVWRLGYIVTPLIHNCPPGPSTECFRPGWGPDPTIVTPTSPATRTLHRTSSSNITINRKLAQHPRR